MAGQRLNHREASTQLDQAASCWVTSQHCGVGPRLRTAVPSLAARVGARQLPTPGLPYLAVALRLSGPLWRSPPKSTGGRDVFGAAGGGGGVLSCFDGDQWTGNVLQGSLGSASTPRTSSTRPAAIMRPYSRS